MRRRHYMGDYQDFRVYTPGTNYGVAGAAAPVRRPVAPQPTLTGQAAGLINQAARPIRWGLFQAGGLVKWVGNTIQSIGSKL